MTGLVITAVGAVTSVGLDAVTTCASIRAGLSRPSVIEEFQVLDIEEFATTGVMGYPIEMLARGFSGVGRWAQLAVAAVEDLCRSRGLPDATDDDYWRNTRWILVVPEIDVTRFPFGPGCNPNQLESTLLATLRERLAKVCVIHGVEVLDSGRRGFFEAISRAQCEIDAGCRRFVVVAMDSLVDAASLAWLNDDGRLKQDGNPVGLMPGEASVALMVEQAAIAEATALGRLGPSVVEEGGVDGLRDAIHRILEELDEHSALVVIVDQNGEPWMSEGYGRVCVGLPWSGSAPEWSSVVPSVGDVGAAAPALQAIVACARLGRTECGGGMITFLDFDGACGAMAVRGGGECRGHIQRT
ncbi:hypothetical protein ACNOYE_00535 [Nannocystaceae bacterium ST9]